MVALAPGMRASTSDALGALEGGAARSAKKACSPCGHVICAACADTNEIKRCPICRGSVEIFLRLFALRPPVSLPLSVEIDAAL